MARGSIVEIVENTDTSGTNQFLLARVGEVAVEELFDPPQLFMEGDIIQVQESLAISTEIARVEAVDIDLGWFGRKVYVGTYRIGVDQRTESATEGDEGFLTSTRFVINRTSLYAVRHPFGAGQFLAGNSKVDACNLELVGGSLQVPLLVGQAVRLFPKENEAVLTSEQYSVLAPLSRALTFFPKLANVGISLRPGIRLLRTEYRRRVINQVETIRPPRTVFPVCSLSNDCDQAFESFLAQRNTGAADLLGEQNYFYRSRDSALAFVASLNGYVNPEFPPEFIPGAQEVLIEGLVEDSFTCPDGSTRGYYIFAQVIG